ncbi:hypothetical protein OSTOST_07653, partial [Ostertagia ostertagi]
MSSTATQRTLLLALSGVSLAALFIWYLRSKKGRSSRRDASIEDVKRSTRTEIIDSFTERSIPRHQLSNNENRIIKTQAILEPSQPCGVVSKTPNGSVLPAMTTALESEPVSNIDSSSTPLINGIVNGLLEGSPKAFDETGDEQQLNQKEADNSAVNEIKEEEQVCKKAVDLQLVLDVSHQPEPEVFSWSDEMERSYVESCKKDEEEQRQQEAAAANGSSGDYATSDSPGLASQNS